MKKTNSLISIFFLMIIAIFAIGTAKDAVRPIYGEAKNIIQEGPSEVIANINAIWDENACQRMNFITLYGATQRALSKRETGNYDIVKDLDGFLHRKYTPRSEKRLGEYAKNMSAFYDYIKKRGDDFLFIETPVDVIKGRTRFPTGFSSDSDKNIDRFMEITKSLEIPVLDSRTLYPGLKHEEIFFKTDHHWATQLSFKAFAATIDRLNEDYGYNLDPDGTFTDLANYKNYMLEDSFLGSVGIRVGAAYAGKDDFLIYLPKFKTDLTLKKYVEHEQIRNRRGDFWHSFIDESTLDPSYNNKHAAYLYGGDDVTVVTNHLSDNKLKCILIADSFGHDFAQYLSLCFETTVFIDPSNGRYTDSMKEYIDNYDPDVVLVLPSGDHIWNMIPGFVGFVKPKEATPE